MPRFEITSPEGKKFEVSAPEGATEQDILAYARSQFAQGPSGEASIADRAKRSAGLLARSAGPVAAGALAGAAMGSVVPGIGTAAGAAAGAGAMTATQIIDSLIGTHGVDKVMDMLGLPKPETPTERVTGDVLGTMAGASGFAKGLEVLSRTGKPVASSVGALSAPPERLLKQLSATDYLLPAAGGAGAGHGIARESGAGPTGQFLSSLAAGAAAPGAIAVGKGVGGTLADVLATISASFGSKKGIERLARDAMTRITGADRERIARVLQGGTEYVPGAKPTVAEAVTEAQMGKPEQFGGALIRLQKELSGAPQIEDILPSVAKRQQMALEAPVVRMAGGNTPQERAAVLEAAKTIRDQETAPLREVALMKANLGTVSGGKIVGHINDVLKKPGEGIVTSTQKVLGAIRDKIAEAAAKRGGRLDAEDLYAIRKTDINDVVSGLTKDLGASTKMHTADLAASVKSTIDDAIESAGGTGWKAYLKKYADLSREIDRMKVAGAIVEKMRSDAGKATPSQALKVLGTGEDALLKKSLGGPRATEIEQVFTPSQARKLRNIEKHLLRQEETGRIASGVKGQPPSEIVAGELPKLPTLLHRPMMAVNFALKMIARDANTPVVREVAMRMRDPKEFAKLLSLPYQHPKRRAAEEIAKRVMIATGMGQTQQ